MERMRNARQRDPDRIPEILALIQDHWEKNPDLRFFQLMYNVLGASPNHPLFKMVQVEDWQVQQTLSEGLTTHD